MKLVVLGSGGSQPTPKVGCDCRVCRAARREGGRHERGGPSLWLPEAGLLIDTPEESNAQLNRFADGALALRCVLWSHFHPDHTAGMRVVEYLARWGSGGVSTFWPDDLRVSLGQNHLFGFALAHRHLEVQAVQAGEPFGLNGLQVTLLRHSGEMPMYSFLLEQSGIRVLYSPDHLKSLDLTELQGLDLAIVQVGLMPNGVQESSLPNDHPARKALLPLEQVCANAQALGWKRLVFTHLYEAIRLFPDEYDALGKRLSDQFGFEIGFAFDGLGFELGSKLAPLSNLSLEDLMARLQIERQQIAQDFAHDRPRMREAMRALMHSPLQLELDARGRKP